MLWEHVEVVKGVLALRERVTGAAPLRDERVVLVLVGVFGRSHEQHVLQIMRQALFGRGWGGGGCGEAKGYGELNAKYEKKKQGYRAQSKYYFEVSRMLLSLR